MESKEKNEGCVFCQLASVQDGPENLILFRTESAFTIINKYPYNAGHLMVIPLVHESDLTVLSPETITSMTQQVMRAVKILKTTYNPTGFNIGMNLGSAAGAGIPDHLHYHIVPRWAGDTNFMPVIGDVKVLPETVEETYNRLKPHY